MTSGFGALPGWRADGGGKADGEFAWERKLWRKGSALYEKEAAPLGVNLAVQYYETEGLNPVERRIMFP
jgi:hypothetical protein